MVILLPGGPGGGKLPVWGKIALLALAVISLGLAAYSLYLVFFG